MGWLENYLEFTQEMESPYQFHLWSAVATLGHVLGRKCWVDRGGKYKVYPGQIMVILVARSAIARKSTAIRMITPFLNIAPRWTAHLLPNKLSPQQLIQSMDHIGREPDGTLLFDPFGRRRDCCGFIAADELGMFFTAEDFARALPTHICDFNDAAPGERLFKFRKWEANVWNPCIGMVGATTPKGLSEELPSTARQAGFLGRCIIVYGEPTGIPNPLTDKVLLEDKKLKRSLEEEFVEIAQMRGPFEWSTKGKKAFDDFYYKYHEWVKTHVDSGLEADDTGYYGRKGDHLIRVATVVSASESRKKVLKADHVRKAEVMLKGTEKEMPEALIEVGTKPHAGLDNKILSLLGRNGRWIPKWKVMRNVRRYGDKRARDQAVEALVETREVRLERVHGVVCLRIVKKGKKDDPDAREDDPVAHGEA